MKHMDVLKINDDDDEDNEDEQLIDFTYWNLFCLKVNSILTHVAQLLKYESDAQLEDLYQKTAWYFDRKFGKPGASYEAFKHAVT